MRMLPDAIAGWEHILAASDHGWSRSVVGAAINQACGRMQTKAVAASDWSPIARYDHGGVDASGAGGGAGVLRALWLPLRSSAMVLLLAIGQIA